MSSGDEGFVVTMLHQTGTPSINFLQGVEAMSKNEFVLIDNTESWDFENSKAELSGDTFQLSLFTTG